MIARHGGRGHGGTAHADYSAPSSATPIPYGTVTASRKLSKRAVANQEEAQDRLNSTVRVLMSGGKWRVPPNERPKLLRPETERETKEKRTR